MFRFGRLTAEYVRYASDDRQCEKHDACDESRAEARGLYADEHDGNIEVDVRDEQQKADEPRKKYGFVAVSVGEGLDEIFKGLNVDHIISCGQTMNPSTEDILNAIDKINADNIYVLPNNKNIILAAQQAESLVEDKNIIVM